MSAILNFLGLPSPTSLIVHLGVLLAVALGAGYAGWHEKSVRDDAALAHAEEIINLKTVKAEQISSDIGQVVETQQLEIASISTVLIQRVTQYVTPKADRMCDLTIGFANLLDQAAGLRPFSDGAGRTPNAPLGTSASAAASNIAANYAICRANAVTLAGWQAWYTKQRALADTKD